MLLTFDNISDKEFPFLILAGEMHPAMGAVFSIILLFGIFSATAPKMWIVCSRISQEGTTTNTLSAVAIIFITFFGATSLCNAYMRNLSFCWLYRLVVNCKYSKISLFM